MKKKKQVNPFAEVDKSKCRHTPGSDKLGYNEWSGWQAEKKKTHNQTQCPNCGLWSVWVKKCL
ncbi:MAG: hypothetical protein GY928_31970 [Colwellia sp.]|nr:hypothetical protein [Colwellia sp.]